MKLAKLKSYNPGYPARKRANGKSLFSLLIAFAISALIALGFASCGKDDKKVGTEAEAVENTENEREFHYVADGDYSPYDYITGEEEDDNGYETAGLEADYNYADVDTAPEESM